MINANDQQLHFAVYKPFGMLSQLHSNDAKELKNKKFLGELHNFPHGTMPIGRLDEKSEGLLLMTTDGKLSDMINRSGIDKEYYVQVDGEITTGALEQLSHGVTIGIAGEKYLTRPCAVRKLVMAPTLPEADQKLRIGRHRQASWISITISEDKCVK